MLVNAVLEPSALDADYFHKDKSYVLQTKLFLKGIESNGVLIVDAEKELRDAIIKEYKSLPDKPRDRLKPLMESIFVQNSSKLIIACPLDDIPYRLRELTEADALIVGDKSLERLKSAGSRSDNIVALSEYDESVFEQKREQYANGTKRIDTLPKSEVDSFIVKAIRFAKRLKFYDPYIGRRDLKGRRNTKRFREGIKYVLSLWHDHAFLASQKGFGGVDIFTCRPPRENIQEYYEAIEEDFAKPLKEEFPWIKITVIVKIDKRRIFHARFLETDRVIIGVDKGFDLFKPNGDFQPNFFTLEQARKEHLKDCLNLTTDRVIGPM